MMGENVVLCEKAEVYVYTDADGTYILKQAKDLLDRKT